MKKYVLKIISIGLLLLISACSQMKDSHHPNEPKVMADWPHYSYEELIEASDAILRVKVISEPQSKKNHVEMIRNEKGEIEERFLPSMVTNVRVLKVIKGKEGLKGEIITLNQLNSEELLQNSRSYMVFVTEGKDGLYYSMGENVHSILEGDQVVSQVDGKTGTFSVDDFEKDIAEKVD